MIECVEILCNGKLYYGVQCYEMGRDRLRGDGLRWDWDRIQFNEMGWDG